MRSVDRLEQQKRIKRQKKNLPPPDEETGELERPRFIPLNERKCVFDGGADKTFGGINSAPSVFDRKAVFHTE